MLSAVITADHRYPALPLAGQPPALERAQIERLRHVRASRSESAVAEKLAVLDGAARTGTNLMPAIMEAAGVHATLGEISGGLKTVFGEYQES